MKPLDLTGRGSGRSSSALAGDSIGSPKISAAREKLEKAAPRRDGFFFAADEIAKYQPSTSATKRFGFPNAPLFSDTYPRFLDFRSMGVSGESVQSSRRTSGPSREGAAIPRPT